MSVLLKTEFTECDTVIRSRSPLTVLECAGNFLAKIWSTPCRRHHFVKQTLWDANNITLKDRNSFLLSFFLGPDIQEKSVTRFPDLHGRRPDSPFWTNNVRKSSQDLPICRFLFCFFGLFRLFGKKKEVPSE